MNDGTDILAARLRKHAAEIERLNAAHRREIAELSQRVDEAWRDGSADGWRRASFRWEWLLIGALIAVAILTIQSEFRIHGLKENLLATQAMLDEARKPWRSDDAPKLQRLTVVSEGFMDKKGEWRSFDDGSRLTVKQWKP